ncbi:hypothetical protein [Aeromonas salmonicida]|uniref:hypothetical protein n=1 Tax=Aeromonas salmonicida TaxID=645 RepID=UPI00223F0A79|nr:hypothetical protein [Aeromonas salmonicida]
MTRTPLLLLALPFCTLAVDGELWQVELEHNDGIRLQFQGAELELGSAALAGVRQFSDLKPGMKLAILSRNGVAEHIRLHEHAPESEPAAQWRRAEGTLLAVTGHALQLQGLGTMTFDAGTRWLNGSPADLQPGRTLVLTRDETGRVTEILIPNPEDEPK